MSKEAAAAILVQTLFTVDASMQNLLMSHAKAGTAKPEEVVKFVLPYYKAMLKGMNSEEGESENKEGDSAANADSGPEQSDRQGGSERRDQENKRDKEKSEGRNRAAKKEGT
jgi:hypothetical protein